MWSRKIRGNDQGIATIIDFIIAFAMFIIIFSLFSGALSTFYRPFERKDIDLQTQALTVSSILTENPGLLRNGSTNWERYPSSTLDEDLIKIGLISSGSDQHILSTSKLTALKNNVTPELARRTLDIKRFFFHITVQNVGTGEILFDYGMDAANARILVTVQRAVLVNTDAEYLSAILIVKLFY